MIDHPARIVGGPHLTRNITVFALLVAVGFAGAFPKLSTTRPATGELAEYKAADQAITTTIRAATPGIAGASGFLGFTVERDATGKLVVDAVQPDSPAKKAGIEKGDIVVRVSDQPVSTPQSVREWVQAAEPGSKIKISIVRAEKAMDVTAEAVAISRPLKPPSGPRPYLGLEVEEVKEGDGVKVKSIEPNSPAAKAQLEVGDLMLKVDGDEFNRPAKLVEVLGYKKPGETLTFVVVGKDMKEKQLTATLATPEPGKGGFGPGGRRPGGGGGNFNVAPSLWKKPTMKATVIPFEFADTKHNSKVTPEELRKLFFSAGVFKQSATGQTAYGSLADYCHEISYGRFKFEEANVLPWAELAKKRGDYVQGTGVSNRTAPLFDALNKAITGDNKDALKDAEAIIFVYAGSRFAQNRGAVFAPHAGTIVHQSRRLPYMLIPEGGSQLTSVGSLAKEAGLMLGLPDLTGRRENVGVEGLGPWCAMSVEDSSRPDRPGHLSPWCKEKLSWITPTVINPSVKQKLILSPIENASKDCLKVLVRPDGSEYLLLENRRKIGADGDLKGEGLLIWRVVNDRPVLQESHGIEGPSGPSNALADVPYPSAANNAYTPGTTPSSRSPLGGGLPVHITGIKRHPDGRVSFRIGYEYE